jgi:DNA polymerase III subunit delta
MPATKILNEWKKRNFKPVYWLEGEEPYFIDVLMNFAEHKILNESEAGFNLSVFYGKDADWASIVNACRRYPMFAEKQVVLLKEAQQMRDIEKLEAYIAQPLESTILVVSYKEKKLDARTKFAKAVKQHGELFSSPKLKDNQLPEYAQQIAHNLGFELSGKALALLVEYIGSDLSRMHNEIEKLSLNLAGRNKITEDDIEQYVGISKEYNTFELKDAVATKDLAKAIRIIQYFEKNPKAAPVQMVLPLLYGYFSQLYSIFGLPDRSEKSVATLFYNNFYAGKLALQAANSYGLAGIEKALLLLHAYNLKSVGVNSSGATDADLMKELVVKLMLT